MRIAVMGTGGVGGYFGGMLARAGRDVTFIARGDHLAAIQRDGLHVNTVHGNFTVRAPATSDVSGIGTVDLVLFCVKSYDTEEATRTLEPAVGSDTVILSLQNGIDNEDKLAARYGAEHILGGLCYISASITAPGTVTQTSGPRTIVFGELDGSLTGRAKRIEELFRTAGIDCTLTDDIRAAAWTKFLLICALSGVASVAQASVGEILALPETRSLLRETMAEVEAVAAVHGVSLAENVVNQMMQTTASFAPETRPSMLVDLEAGNRIELHALNGTVARLGSEASVPTPANRFIYAALRPADERARRSPSRKR
jgi:2-dehydropantoate 2-reductase